MNIRKLDTWLPNQASLLKFAAVAIAAPRYAGAFAAAIGLNALERYAWFAHIEIATGAAMAILEGFAIAFVLARWRLLKPGLQWGILLTFILLLAASLPAVAVPYLLAEQNSLAARQIFAESYALQVAWSFLVAGVPMLVVMAVGFADMPDEAEQSEIRANERRLQSVEQANRRKEQQQIRLPFACDNCGKRFKNQNGLNGHKGHCTAKVNGHVSDSIEVLGQR